MARVELTDDAKDDIRALDGSVRKRVLKDILKLVDQPSLRGAPLGSHNSGNLTGFRKLYVGPKHAYRVVFATEGDTLAIVMVVAEREDQACYELALARVRMLSDAEQKDEVVTLLKSLVDSE